MAKAVHSLTRKGPASIACDTSPVLRRRLKTSIRPCRVKPPSSRSALTSVRTPVLESNPEGQVFREWPERTHGEGQLLDTPGFSRRRRQVRRRSGRRVRRRHRESLLPEIVAQNNCLPVLHGRGCTGLGEHTEVEIHAHGLAIFQTGERFAFDEAKARRADLHEAVRGGDGQRLRGSAWRGHASAATSASAACASRGKRSVAARVMWLFGRKPAASPSGPNAAEADAGREHGSGLVGIERETNGHEEWTAVHTESGRDAHARIECRRPTPIRSRERAPERYSDIPARCETCDRRRLARCRICPTRVAFASRRARTARRAARCR